MHKIIILFLSFFSEFSENKAYNTVPLDIVSQESIPFLTALCFCCWWHQDISFLHLPFFHQNLEIFQFLQKNAQEKTINKWEGIIKYADSSYRFPSYVRFWRILIKRLKQHLVKSYVNAATVCIMLSVN